MTQNDKDLLLKDLCARLPYGVKFACNNTIYTAKGLDTIVTDEGDWEYAVTAKGVTPIEIDLIKPYLFPLESMTEEQYYEMQSISGEDCLNHMELEKAWRNNSHFNHLPLYQHKVIEFFHKHHFDYRGLIPMGLAIDATGLNIYQLYANNNS